MEKEKESNRDKPRVVSARRKRSAEYKKEKLPTPPPDPQQAQACADPPEMSPPEDDVETDPFRRLLTYGDRESQFLKLLCDSDTSSSLHRIFHAASEEDPGAGADAAFDSPNDFLMLLNRTGPSVAAALSTKGALDQLDRLHDLIEQLLSLQEQNMRMHLHLRTMETFRKQKLLQNWVSCHFTRSSERTQPLSLSYFCCMGCIWFRFPGRSRSGRVRPAARAGQLGQRSARQRNRAESGPAGDDSGRGNQRQQQAEQLETVSRSACLTIVPQMT